MARAFNPAWLELRCSLVSFLHGGILQDAQDRWTLRASDWVRGAAELFGFGKVPGEELYLDKSLTPAGMGTQARLSNPKKEEEKGKPTCSMM